MDARPSRRRGRLRRPRFPGKRIRWNGTHLEREELETTETLLAVDLGPL